MDRIYNQILREHFSKYRQMIFLLGPRQVGKTTISDLIKKQYKKSNSFYLNWDQQEHQELILSGTNKILEHTTFDIPSKDKKLIIFDELHKYRNWRNFLKGFFDLNQDRVNVLVTGSARLDVFRYGGDSLMGRYFPYRVHPLSIREVVIKKNQAKFSQEINNSKKIDQEVFDYLLKFGGFPEPFLTGTEQFYNRWKELRHQQLFEEDLRDLSKINDLARLKFVAAAIKNQACELVNYTNFSKLAKVSVDTIQSWFNMLNNLYYCFLLKPWHKNINRSLIKQPKVYLWDWGLLSNNIGARNENFVASHLLKAVNLWTDLGLGTYDLFFLRNKDQKEVDFLVTKDEVPWFIIEVKTSSKEPISKSLMFFQKQTNAKHAFQVVMDLPYQEINCFEYTAPVKVPLITFLSQLV